MRMQAKILRTILAVVLALAMMPAGALAVSSGELTEETAPLLTGQVSGDTVWNGIDADVSWYLKDPGASRFRIGTAAELAGAAALVNGLVNGNCRVFVDETHYYPASWWNRPENGYVLTDGEEERPDSQNQSTDQYYYGIESFKDKTIILTADLDMGGICDEQGVWSGPVYMPLGGQYLMTKNDSTTKLSSSFCGTFDGNGHYVRNIYCDRHCSNGNYGDGQSVGFIGRLGVHDNDPEELRPTEPTVKNLAVTGYVYGNRSVGGIVGKTGKTAANNAENPAGEGAVISGCVNYATVSNTDAKGCGGICGAFWNGGLMENCINAGAISTTYPCPTGGLAGSNENPIANSYNIGAITASNPTYAMAIGTNNGGAGIKKIVNCWYLDGSAMGGGYYTSRAANNSGAMSAEDMQSAAFAETLGSAFTADLGDILQGYPVLKWQTETGEESSIINYTICDNDSAAADPAVCSFDSETGNLTVHCDTACAAVLIRSDGSSSLLETAEGGPDAGGSAVFAAGELEEGSQLAVVYRGDINLDGMIGPEDCEAVKRAVLETDSLEGLSLLIADVNRDGTADSMDAAAVKAVYKGKLTLSW